MHEDKGEVRQGTGGRIFRVLERRCVVRVGQKTKKCRSDKHFCPWWRRRRLCPSGRVSLGWSCLIGAAFRGGDGPWLDAALVMLLRGHLSTRLFGYLTRTNRTGDRDL